MARLLYGVSPADYVIDGATGLPKSGVVLNVYDAIGGTQIFDLKGVTGTTYAEGSAITQVTSNSIGMYPFYAPDGESGSLALRDAAGAGAWYVIGPSTEGDILATLAGTVATLQTAVTANTLATAISSPTTRYLRGDNTWQTLNADVVPDGTTNKAYTATEKTKLSTVQARINHTGTQTHDTISDWDTAVFATSQLQDALNSKASIFLATGDDSNLTAALGSVPAGYTLAAVKVAGT